MKLSFSTNGWNSNLNELVSIAKSLGIEGIEIHNAKSFQEHAPFSDENVLRTLRFLNENNVAISCIDATSNLADPAKKDEAVKEIKELIELAKNLRCEYIRIHAMHVAELSNEEEDELIKSIISETLDFAIKNNIILLLETMGIFADTLRIKKMLDSFADDNLAAVWDFHHTYQFGHESVNDTIKNFGAYVKHVHVKDSKIENGKVNYVLLGEGDLPIKDVFAALRSINYEGYLSLEMRPQWIDSVLGADIVFPQFVNYMSFLKDRPAWKSELFNNKRNTGKFVWKKETLIEKTFSDVLDTMVYHFPDQIAIKYSTLDYTRTYKEFRDDVNNFAKSLIALGVKHGDKVAVWASNVPEWYIAFWATTKIGAILVTVNTAYKIHEIEYLLRQSDTKILVLTESYQKTNYAEIINELCPELKDLKMGEKMHAKALPFLRHVITVGFKNPGSMTFAEALELGKKVPLDEVLRRAKEVDIHDVCNMQYTSGTTGFPKGVMLTHYNVVNNGKCIGDRMDLSTADRMMIQVPMFHCFGMVLAMTASMTHGVSIYPLPYYSPRPALECINQEKITCFHGVPTMFIAMLSHEYFPNVDFSYMRTGIMAGSPCPVAVMREVVEKMNMKEITIVYGQTEASPGCTMSTTEDPIDVRVETVGGPLPNIECKIVDPETNQDLPDNTVGEFVARGYNIMKGYYKMPKETAQAIDKDGWLHTGDLALRRPDGNYKITGRLKDMIIRGGENIYPKELEDFIYTYPKVSDVQVVGVPDEKYGEEVYAYVIVKEGETMTTDELRDYMIKNIARHKVPRYIDLVTSFPMNAAGKILKYKMREEAEEKIKNKLI